MDSKLIAKSLAELFPEYQVGLDLVGDWQQRKVTGISEDSRRIVAGDIFVARDGEHFKGSDYIAAAITNGAVAVLVDKSLQHSVQASVPVIGIENLNFEIGEIAAKVFGNVTDQLTIIGVTGTNGKTSCAHYLAQALNALGVNSFIIGTLGNGHPDALQEADRTTPDACSLQRLFAQFYQQGAAAVIMEVSSHAIEQGRVQGVPFSVVAYTHLSRDHLDYHGTMQAYAQAKAKLFTQFESQFKVLNREDPYNLSLLESLVNEQVSGLLSYSEADSQGADLAASELSLKSGLSFKLRIKSQSAQVQTQLLGKFNVANLLLVSSVLHALDYSLEQIQQSLNGLVAVPGRMQRIVSDSSNYLPMCVVDYAHTPDALEKALQTSRVHCDGQLIVVFGCGGDRDTGKRAEMAQIAEKFADKLLVTSDNPRTENPDDIIQMIVDGLSGNVNYLVESDRKQAIVQAVAGASGADVVLIAGKGHENYQEIMQVKYPFLDAQVVAQALLEKQSDIQETME